MGSPPTPAPSRRVSPNDTQRYIIAQRTMWGKEVRGREGKGGRVRKEEMVEKRACGREANAMDT